MRLIAYAIFLTVAVPVAAVASCAIYLTRIPSVYLVALTRVLIARPTWLPDPPGRMQSPEGSDPAVAQYFYGPAMIDVAHAAQIAFYDGRRIWRLGLSTTLKSARTSEPRLSLPITLASIAGMTAGSLLGAFASTCCVLLHGSIAGLLTIGVQAFNAALRGAILAVLRIRGIKVTCPTCSKPVPHPGYVCPGNGCRRRHHNLLPGRFGTWQRHCYCGTSMNLLSITNSSRTATFCPHCAQILEHHPADNAEIFLPIFGTSTAARINVLNNIASQLREWDGDGQLTASFADPAAAQQSSSAYIIRLPANMGLRTLRTFDAGDKEISSTKLTRGHERTAKAPAIVFAFDQLPVTSLPGRSPAQQPGSKPEGHAGPNLHQAYERALQAIAAAGITIHEARLAVVFVSDDRVDSSSRKVARWACHKLGFSDFVAAVHSEFKECRFFCIPESKAGDRVHKSVTSLVRWLLAGHDVFPSPSRVVADFNTANERSYRWHRRYVFVSIAATFIAFLLALAL